MGSGEGGRDVAWRVIAFFQVLKHYTDSIFILPYFKNYLPLHIIHHHTPSNVDKKENGINFLTGFKKQDYETQGGYALERGIGGGF